MVIRKNTETSNMARGFVNRQLSIFCIAHEVTVNHGKVHSIQKQYMNFRASSLHRRNFGWKY